MHRLRAALLVLLLIGAAACAPSDPVTDVAPPAAAGSPSSPPKSPSQSPSQPPPQSPAPSQPPQPQSPPQSPPSSTAVAAGAAGAVDVVVNKRRPLRPVDYAPTELRRPDVAATSDDVLLRPETAAAAEEMFAAAGDDGVGLVLLSGYRSYADQESTYAYWVGRYGDASAADTVSARPGFSEHQTGLALDIGQADGSCTLVLCFRDTPAAQWAAAHAADFGFILRYPLGFHEITGFSAESWHFRYVGRDVSLGMRAAGTRTLEEYLGLPAAPSY